MRLDLYLTQHYNIQSRNKACELIKENKIKIDGKIINKPSFTVEQKCDIEILENDFFVSRAAYKLKYFLEDIALDLNGLNALDIGSSTGGFTQILLNNGVSKVTCVDVGTNQLHETLKNEKKIEFFENTDIRNFNTNESFDIVTCDVSFISVLNILDSINHLASDKIILLFKPQFEVGANVKRDKKGVVKDKKAIELARIKFLDAIELLNWKLIFNANSKLQGKDGNNEELFYFNK